MLATMSNYWQIPLLTILFVMLPNSTHDESRTADRVRPATQAGRFYEADPSELMKELDACFGRHGDTPVSDDIAALVVPHAGYYFSANVAASAFAMLRPEHRYQRIFLLGPSHYAWLNGASVNVADDYYSTPLGTIPVDHATAAALIAADSVFHYNERAHDREHCLEVQLPFLQTRLSEMPPIVPIIISTNKYDHLKRIAAALKPYFTPDNLFVISSDFSHYPTYEGACRADKLTGDALLTGNADHFIDVIEENARRGIPGLETSACGEFAIITLLMMLDSQYDVRHILYQNSGDIDPERRDRVVGYHSFAVMRRKGFSLTEEDKNQLHEIAWRSLTTAFEGKPIPNPEVSDVLKTPCGAFVTLKKNGQLRGCIGYMAEDTPLHEIVAEMARSAAFEDFRFPRLQRSELRDIDVEISVLTPRRRIQSIDEFQLHRHGLLIRKGNHSGTFLPQVADEVNWTKEEFFGHCARDKAGIGWDGWRDAELYVYEAIVF